MVFHVLNRGVVRHQLFFNDHDYLAFERIIADTKKSVVVRQQIGIAQVLSQLRPVIANTVQCFAQNTLGQRDLLRSVVHVIELGSHPIHTGRCLAWTR